VCGETDFGWTGAWGGYPDSDEAILMRIGDEPAALAWCENRYGRDGSGFLQAGLTGLAPPDVAALDDDELARALLVTVREAFRQGVGGYAQDVVAQARAWSFDPRAIVAPAWVLHGELDALTPLAHARHSAEVIPTARLVTRPEQGHISVLTEIPQLAADLLEPLR
jgi:pimeloyl-ACP methyl ester carboxylesterase